MTTTAGAGRRRTARPSGGPTAARVAAVAELAALGHPLRYRIFEHLTAEPRTARQMADLLGVPPTRLYHHFAALQRAGLIRAAGTRQKRGTVEKYFEAAVDRLEMTVMRGRPVARRSLIAGLLDATLHGLQPIARRPADSTAYVFLKRYRIRATARQRADIQARLDAVAEACERAAADGTGRPFAVTLAFYEEPTRTGEQRPRRPGK